MEGIPIVVKSTSTKPQKTALVLAQRIVHDIERQGLTVGQMLPPEHLMMDAYATGRGTLRESLRFLELQGVLSFKPGPGGGPMIRRPGAEHLATTLALVLQFDGSRYQVVAEARSILEPPLARAAAQRISADQLSELDRSVRDLEDAVDDVAEYLRIREHFHQIIAAASGNPLFAHLVEALTGPLDPTAGDLRAHASAQRRRAVLQAHRRILEAIAAADPAAAHETMRAHLDECLGHALEHHPQILNRQITWTNRPDPDPGD